MKKEHESKVGVKEVVAEDWIVVGLKKNKPDLWE